MTNHDPLGRDPESQEISVPIISVQRNSVAWKLPSTDAIVAVVIVEAKLAWLPGQTKIHDTLGTVRVNLKSTEVSFVANGPAKAPSVITVKALVAENETLASGDYLDVSTAVILGDGATRVFVAHAELSTIGEGDLVPAACVRRDELAVVVCQVL